MPRKNLYVLGNLEGSNNLFYHLYCFVQIQYEELSDKTNPEGKKNLCEMKFVFLKTRM